MKSANHTPHLRGAYEAPRCETVDVRAERGLCLSTSHGASHDGFSENDFSNDW